MTTNLGNKKGLEYSPFGEKSKEVVKRRITKRKSSKSLLNMFERESISMLESDSTATDSSFQLDSSLVSSITEPMHHKRFRTMNTNDNDNPKTVGLEEADHENNSQISPPIDWDDSVARSPFDSPFTETMNKISKIYPIDFSDLNKIKPAKSNKHSRGTAAKLSSCKLPEDVRLGTKLRLVSERPFPWLEKIYTPGVYPVNIYIHANDFQMAMNLDANMEREQQNSISALACLQSAAIYHQFPSIGSVQLFPRRNIGSKSTLKSANLQTIEPSFIEDISRQWSESFNFLFHRWLADNQKAFYLCSPQFTIYFANSREKARKTPSKTPQKPVQKSAEKSPRKSATKTMRTPLKKNGTFGTPKKSSSTKSPFKNSTSNECQHQQQQQLIVITPTTTGFRQNLMKNGVHFSCPFKAEFVDLSQEECPRDFLPNDEDHTAGLDHDEWLKDIGISPKTTLRLKRSASELDTPPPPGEGESSSVPADIHQARLSGTPPTETSRSTILIRGAKDAGALYEVLSKNPHLINTKTGPQAGLPPTLISHCPFRHSRMNELAMTSQLIKKAGAVKYVLELDHGPVMATTVEMLFHFVRKMAPLERNKVLVQLTGRQHCNGMNEALDRDKCGLLANFNELEWDGCRFEYS